MNRKDKKNSIIKRTLKKKLKKKMNAIIGIFNTGIVLFILVLFMMFAAIIQDEIKDTPNISDIGAMGVPYELVEHFNNASEIFNIPNWTLAAIAKQESNFNPNSSYGGAYGIMQIQRIDPGSGNDLWKYLINLGLGDIYKQNGYNFSSYEDMWNIYLNDAKAQILAGAYEIRYYANYVLYRKGKTQNLNYNSNENMKLIDWKADEGDYEFKELLKRTFACYNGGPGYGMSVDLNNAQYDYPNKVFQYAMEFRNSGIGSDSNADSNEIIETAIKAGERWMGSPYIWGGGRNQTDVDLGRFDCSSLIHYMYASAGVQLGARDSVVTFSLVNMGKGVPESHMKRGDLIFFDTYTTNGHIAVYLGNGNFIHCGSNEGVTISNLNNSYYKSTFNGTVRRIVE